jgi:hypothetical protein
MSVQVVGCDERSVDEYDQTGCEVLESLRIRKIIIAKAN